MRHRIRTRAGAALGVVFLVSTLTVLVAPSAGAVEQNGPNNCAAPSASDCPAGTSWTYTSATNVVQNSSGGENFFKCTAPSCVGEQNNTSGKNRMVIAQSHSASGTNAAVTQTANGKQSNQSGLNDLDVTQQANLSNPNPTLLANLNFTSAQGVIANQTNQSGGNNIGIGQNVFQNAAGNINILTAAQKEQAQQSVHVPLQSSNSGDQHLTVNQHENLTQNLNAVGAKQEQNVDPVVGQKVLIGDGNPDPEVNDGVYTVSGANTVSSSQTQVFSQKANGFIGLISQPLLSAAQTMGSQDETFPAAVLNWEVDAEEGFGGESHTTCFQSKDWDQDTTPDAPLQGKTQKMWDELAIIGNLFSTDFAECDQHADTTQDGPGESYRCVQLGTIHTNVLGSLSQNCNGTTQSVEAKSFDAALYDCHNLPDAECDESNTHVTVTEEEEEEETDTTGEFGCGQGFWKAHTDLWPASVNPSSLFQNHFDGTAGYASLTGVTMLQAISASGGGSTLDGAAGNLGRAAVAALLNAKHPDVPYELTSAEVKDAVEAALGSQDRLTIEAQASEFEGYNNGAVCPLGGPAA